MIDFDLKYRILPEPHDGLLSVYHLMYIHTHFPIIALNICGSLRDEGMNERHGMNK